MKIQVGKKGWTLQDYHNMQVKYTWAQYHTFLVKSIKGNKIYKVALKIDKISISQANYQNALLFHLWSMYSC